MRIIEKEFTKELPASASDMLASAYSKDFARSDADFSIYINPNLPKFSEHVSKITQLAYHLQQAIIEDFADDLPLFYEFFRFNSNYQKATLASYFEAFKNSKCFSDPSNVKFYGKKLRQIVVGDVAYPGAQEMPYIKIPYKLIEFDANETEIKITPLQKSSSIFYLVDNRALHFQNGPKNIRFNLVRTKVNFNLIVENSRGTLENYPMGGELIDVSIPLDQSLGHFFSALHKNVAEYHLDFHDASLKFRSYTLAALVHDIEEILFYGDSLPWDQGKYLKRINRLLYLYFVDINIRDLSHRERINYLEGILNNVLYPLQYLSAFNVPNIVASIQSIVSKTPEYLFSTWLKKIADMLPRFSQTQEFRTFVGVCVANVLNFAMVAKNSDDFQKTYGQVKESDIYKGDIKYSLF